MCEALRKLMKPEMEEAVDNTKVEIAERMIHKDKYSNTEIADISGLTVNQVQKLKAKTLNMK